MIFSRDYRRPFWRGLLHAVLVAVYVIFITLVSINLGALMHTGIPYLIEAVFGLFVLVVSVALCGYLIFFEPMKMILKRHFKAGSVMLASTLGWLFIFQIIFIVGLTIVVAG